ncbi:MAG: tetratricopeptide repeat protein [Armatimonadota bacterium]|nr:tetratricopeptide repeat protein [Armatimonadota bacterium]
MKKPNEQLLSTLLLELSARQTEANPMWDRTFERLVEARFAADGVSITETTRSTHLDRLHQVLRERPSVPEAHRNGAASTVTAPSLSPIRVPRLAWAGLAAVLLFGIGWYALTRITASPPAPFVAGNQDVPKQAPTIIDPKPPAKPDVKEPGSQAKPTPPPTRPPAKQSPTKTLPEVLLAQNVEVGSFTAVMGEPTVTRLGTRRISAALPKMALYAGTRIETGDADRAQIRLSDGSTIALGFNTSVEIPIVERGNQSRPYTPARIDLVAGKVDAKVTPSETRGRLSVHTPVATVEVLGTEFSLALEQATIAKTKKLRAVLMVKEGRVAFYNEFDRRVVGASMGSIATEGSAPTEPKRLASLRDYRFPNEVWTVLTSRLNELEAAPRFVYPLGWAGFSSATLPEREVRVVSVGFDSPAWTAGLKVGDVIVTMNGEEARTSEAVHRAINAGPGIQFVLTIRRNDKLTDVTFETVPAEHPPPKLPSELSTTLFAATRLAMVGKLDESLEALLLLVEYRPHAAIFNNLGVAYEMKDELGKAIRQYHAAIRLDPKRSLYHYNLGLALEAIGNLERSVEELEMAVGLDQGLWDAVDRLAMGYTLLDRHEEATALLQTVGWRFARNPDLWTRHAFVLWTLGKYSEARKFALKAIQIDPQSSYAYFMLGNIFDREERYSEAIGAYQKSLALNPRMENVRTDLGILLEAFERFEAAEAVYRVWTELEPHHIDAHLKLGNLLMRLKRMEEAEAMLRTAIELDPQGPSAHIDLGTLFQRTNRLKEAEGMFRTAIVLGNRSGLAHFNLGVILGAVGRDSEAEAAYRAAMELAPDKASPRFNLANLLAKEGRLAEAESRYRDAIQLDPKHINAHINLGNLYRGTGRLADAEVMYRKTIVIQPNHAGAYNNLAGILHTMGKLEDAEATYRKAAELNPNDVGLHMNLGMLLNSRGRPEEAEDSYRKALALAPDSPQILNNLAWHLAELGIRLDEALDLAQRAVTAAPADPGVLDTMGRIQYKRMDFKEAELALLKAIEIYAAAPEASDCWVHLGAVYEAVHQRQKAIDAYRAALTAQPGHKEASEALKRIGG